MGLTELQMAQARAAAAIARGMRRYEALAFVYRKTNELPDSVLDRLVVVLQRLTPDELDAALGYAEGLAAWAWVDQSSVDATLAKEGPETGATTGAGERP